MVRDKTKKPYIIIECKTATDEKGKSEYEDEINHLNQDGGQLFSYYWQEQETKFLCLYTSDFGDDLHYKNKIISMTDDEVYINTNKIELAYKNAKNEKDCFEVWCKTYKKESSDNGIFDDDILPYEAFIKAKTFKDLKEFGGDDKNGIYNKFATILRRHNISGKENAFDKLVNLFLCKIYDEFFNAQKLEFVYLDKIDTFEDLQDRLMQLYQNAMQEFLGEKITFVSNEDVNNAFIDKKSLDELKNAVNDFIKRLKFYSNNDFAFLEVHNEELFYKNGLILVEIVKLFSEFKLTQNQTNQFLGNLFELFLQKGMKQDEGQFFTPMQICEFIIYSLPLDTNYLNNKMPKVIDYACGAGHFLNTYANFIQNFITDKEQLKQHFARIYGIEKEYRLSKVAKVSSAMYGQSSINIAYFDALASYEFAHPSDNKKSKIEIKNFDFDILVANPPYSVDGFLSTISENSKKNFDIFNELNLNEDKADAIECFFIERANQLLKDDAISAIILPISILSKDGVYKKAREIILQNFAIRAIVKFDKNTFGATGTETVVLFLQKYKTYQNNPAKSMKYADISSRIKYENLTDNSSFNENYLYDYCDFMGYDSKEYQLFLNSNLSENLKNHEVFQDYFKEFAEKTLKDLRKSKIYKSFRQPEKQEAENKAFISFCDEIEREKLLYFALTKGIKTLIIKRPEEKETKKDTKLSKEFLGYEWSERKGSEGIKELNTPYLSPLFERNNPNNENKLNFLIKQSFLNNDEFEVPQELQKYAFIADLCDLINFQKVEFDKAISLNKREMAQMEFVSKYPTEKIGKIINENPKSKIKVLQAKDNENGEFPFFTSGNNVYKYDEYLIDGENIYLSTGGNAIVKFYNGKSAYSTDTYAIKSKNSNVLNYYLFIYLHSIVDYIDKFLFKGMELKHLQKNDFKDLKIPLPPLAIQQQIVAEVMSVDNQIQQLKEEIEELKSKPTEIFNTFNVPFIENENYQFVKLDDICEFKRGPFGGSLKKEIFVSQGYKIYEQQHAIRNDFSIGDYFITEKKFNEMKAFEVLPNDLIVSCSGTIGKIAIAPDNLQQGIINQALLRLRIKTDKISSTCLKLILDNFENNPFVENSHGAGLKNVANVNTLKNIKIPLPPLETQQKIIAEFERLQQTIQHNEQQIATLKNEYNRILDKYLK
ncbi:MAG: restriction endonuclease subunit S [Neisseriaceae bacterium]|nr:restriction endonuclease subunit S [Neisseriaceae bacterium]